MISFNNNIFGEAKVLIQDVVDEWSRHIPPGEASLVMSDINAYKRNMRVAFEKLVTGGFQHDESYMVYNYLMEILDLLYCELDSDFLTGMAPDDPLPANYEYVRVVDLEWD